jgi:mRNA interferase MazF
VKGDVIVAPVIFTDLSGCKRRPALVVASGGGDDLIICKVTSRSVRDRYAVQIDQGDFESGSLKRPSNVRPNQFMTIDRKAVLYTVGRLTRSTVNKVIDRCVEVLRQ